MRRDSRRWTETNAAPTTKRLAPAADLEHTGDVNLIGFGVFAAAYLVGSLPFSYWVVRWTRGIDVRQVGSGNPGATNVLRAAGPAWAATALGLDALKGVLPVMLAGALWPETALAAWAAFGAVCGHVFSFFLRFRGGKGVATAAGALGAISLPALGVGVAIFATCVLLTRYVSLGSIAAAVAFPVALWWFGSHGGSRALLPVVLIALLVVVRHRANITRLLAGEEARLGGTARGAQ